MLRNPALRSCLTVKPKHSKTKKIPFQTPNPKAIPQTQNKHTMNFSKRYPHTAYWVESQGWLEIGTDNNSSSLVRLLDTGGVVWEDEESSTVDEALQSLEDFLKEEAPKIFGEGYDV